MDAWERVRQLAGQTLETADRRRKFEIDAVGNKTLVVIPEGAYPHAILRERLEQVIRMHAEDPRLTRADVQKAMPRNRTTSYLFAISQKCLHSR